MPVLFLFCRYLSPRTRRVKEGKLTKDVDVGQQVRKVKYGLPDGPTVGGLTSVSLFALPDGWTVIKLVIVSVSRQCLVFHVC